jgi:hypothetical protein
MCHFSGIIFPDKKVKQMSKIVILSLLIACFQGFTTYGQSVVKDSSSEGKSNIDLDFSYGSNYSVYGIFSSFTSQPNTSPSIYYSGKNGLSLSASGFITGNSNASAASKNSSELDLTGGWDFNFMDNSLIISPSFSHFIYSAGAATAKSSYSDQAEIDLSGSFKWLRPSVTADYLFGSKKAVNLNFTLGFNLKINNLLAEGNTLEFEPSLGANYGDLSYSDLIAARLFQILTPLRTTYGDNVTIQQLETNGAFANKKLVGKQLSILNPSATLGQIFSAARPFQVNSIDISLPLAYKVKNLTISSGLNISKPMNVPVYINGKTVVFFTAGLNYSFEL